MKSIILSAVLTFFSALPFLGHPQEVVTARRRVVSAGGATYSIVHNTTADVTAGGSSSGNITIPSTTAGNAFVVIGSMFSSGVQTTITSITNATCTSTWAHATAAQGYNNGSATDAWYCLNIAAGQTLITANLSNSTNSDLFEFWEVQRSSGSPAYDTAGGAAKTTCTSCAGVTLTLAGTGDFVAQAISSFNGCTAVSSPWSTNFFNSSGSHFYAVAASLNPATGAAPTWTCTSGTAAVGAVALK